MINTAHELFTDRAAIIKLVDADHQITMDATIWVYKLGELAGDQCGQYTVVDEYDDKQGVRNKQKEFIYKDVEDAVDHYLELVKEWIGK